MRELVTAKPASRASPYRDRIIPAADLPSPPAAPYAQHYTLRLPDGDWVELPLIALPPDENTAIVSLCISENSFDLEDRLSTAMAVLTATCGRMSSSGCRPWDWCWPPRWPRSSDIPTTYH